MQVFSIALNCDYSLLSLLRGGATHGVVRGLWIDMKDARNRWQVRAWPVLQTSTRSVCGFPECSACIFMGVSIALLVTVFRCTADFSAWVLFPPFGIPFGAASTSAGLCFKVSDYFLDVCAFISVTSPFDMLVEVRAVTRALVSFMERDMT